jgi:hypothetical protein
MFQPQPGVSTAAPVRVARLALYAPVREAVFGDTGVSVTLSATETELEHLRRLVTEHWLNRIAELYSPRVVAEFHRVGLPRYHELASRVDHKALWPKSARLLSPASIAQIRNMEFMQALAGEFGPFGIANEEAVYAEEICWRIVRPLAADDVGPIHADGWFWDLGHGVTPPGAVRVKVWIPLYSEPGMNGLKVLSGSHRQCWPFHAEFRDGITKPQIDFDPESVNLELLPIPPGKLAVFHDRLLHAGALNTGATTRNSIEFTMFVSRESLLACGYTDRQIDGAAPQQNANGAASFPAELPTRKAA